MATIETIPVLQRRWHRFRPEWLCCGLMAVVLLTPKPLAAQLEFNTYAVQIVGFLITGLVAASREGVSITTLRPWTRSLRKLGATAGGVILCAGTLEAAQPLVHRTARWHDLALNVCAVMFGTAIAATGVGLRRYRAPGAPAASPIVQSPTEPVAMDRRRFFIVSTGRTGSTLLAAILADSGAEFGLAVPRRWDRQDGDMEHSIFKTVARRMISAHRIAPERPNGVKRWRWTLLRSRAKRELGAALRRVRYVKVEGGHMLVRPAFKLGYFPTVILSYRRFEDYAVSLGLRRASATIQSLEQNYHSTLRSGLWLLNTFGGCVVSYQELVDPAAEDWAEPLSRVTGIPAQRLIAARTARLETASAQVLAHDTERHAAAAFDTVDGLRNRWLPPSTQALRSWQERGSTEAPPGRRWRLT